MSAKALSSCFSNSYFLLFMIPFSRWRFQDTTRANLESHFGLSSVRNWGLLCTFFLFHCLVQSFSYLRKLLKRLSWELLLRFVHCKHWWSKERQYMNDMSLFIYFCVRGSNKKKKKKGPLRVPISKEQSKALSKFMRKFCKVNEKQDHIPTTCHCRLTN